MLYFICKNSPVKLFFSFSSISIRCLCMLPEFAYVKLRNFDSEVDAYSKFEVNVFHPGRPTRYSMFEQFNVEFVKMAGLG